MVIVDVENKLDKKLFVADECVYYPENMDNKGYALAGEFINDSKIVFYNIEVLAEENKLKLINILFPVEVCPEAIELESHIKALMQVRRCGL